jgi:cytochrome c-type biogenesis protein CcmH
VDEGEALALARDRDLLGRPAQLFETALTLEPGYGKGLWYGALADAQAGNSTRASERLRQLLQQELPEQLRTVVQARLEALGGMAAEPPPKTAEAASEAVSGRLVVQVTLAPALAAKVPPGATLFVFAKAAGGPPMPLAVQRLPGARLPVTVTLDDSMAMMPSMKLSQFERYVLTARLSATGGAQASAGDLEGSLEASRGHDGVLALEISRVVP